MCVITIENIAAEAVIGVEEHERMRPTPVTATVTVSYDSAAAEKEDDIARAVDYALLSQTVCETVAGSRCRLLETLAGKLGERILQRFAQAETVTVRLCKPGILPEAAAVWVEISRRRSAGQGGRSQ